MAVKRKPIKFIYEVEIKTLLNGIGKAKLIAKDDKDLLIKFPQLFPLANIIKVLNKTIYSGNEI